MALGRFIPSCSIRIYVGLGRPDRRKAWTRREATPKVERALRQFFPGMTLTHTRGVYRRAAEQSIGVEILRTEFDRIPCKTLRQRARCAAAEIRRALKQDSVLLVVHDPQRRWPLATEAIRASTPVACPLPARRRRAA